MQWMLSIRQMNSNELDELQHRMEMVFHAHGRDAKAVIPLLHQRALRARREPFWFPVLMTNQELLAHLGASSDVASTTGTLSDVFGFGSIAGAAHEVARNGTFSRITGSRLLLLAWASAMLGRASGHYGERESAYRVELSRRGVFAP